MSTTTKVLVFGLDSGDADLISRWIDDGSLPNFRALRERAAWGTVRNPQALEAGSTWPTFYNGLWPGRHRQYDGVRYFDPKIYDFNQYGPGELKVDPVWTRLSRAGRRVAVVDSPYSFLDESINGVNVIDWGTHVPARGGRDLHFMAHPPELAKEIVERWGPEVDPFQGHMCDHFRPRTVEELDAFRAMCKARIERKAEMCADLLQRESWDFFQVVFGECHCMGHHAWHVNDRNHPEYDPVIEAQIGNPLRDVYIALDQALGRLMAAAGKDATVILFASHGIGPGYSATRLLDRILYRLEFGQNEGWKERARLALRTAWRQLPDGLRKWLQPMQKSAYQKMFDAGFVGKRPERKAFEVYANDRTGGIRVNLIGREPEGKVQPGREYDELLDRITSDLKEIVNVETGEPLVAEIVRTKDAYGGEFASELPDLLVTWNRNAPINLVRSPKIGTMRHDARTPRTGDHRPDGVFYAAGPGCRAGHLNHPVRVTDFAPTIADLLGLEAGPAEFDGEPIKAVGAAVPAERRAGAMGESLEQAKS